MARKILDMRTGARRHKTKKKKKLTEAGQGDRSPKKLKLDREPDSRKLTNTWNSERVRRYSSWRACVPTRPDACALSKDVEVNHP